MMGCLFRVSAIEMPNRDIKETRFLFFAWYVVYVDVHVEVGTRYKIHQCAGVSRTDVRYCTVGTYCKNVKILERVESNKELEE